MTRWCVAAGAALALASGCDTEGPAVDTAAELCAAVVSESARVQAGCLGATAEATASAFAFRLPCDRVAEAVEARALGFDASKVDACLDAVRSLTCWDLSYATWPPRACGPALPARASPGEPCFTETSLECIGGYCTFDACDAPGACAQFVALGGECLGARCGDGLTCDGTFVCAAVTISGAGGPCGNGEICGEGLYCDTGASEPVCAAQGTGSCASEAACIPGYRCLDGTCTARKAIGEACTTGLGECVRGAYCKPPGDPGESGVAGLCAAVPRAGSGPCGYPGTGEEIPCVESWCDASNSPPFDYGTCRDYLLPDAPCSWGNPQACGPGGLCDGTEHCAVAYCHEW
jgi:hypothetical protein